MNTTLLIYGAAFLCAFLMAELLFQLYSRRSEEARIQRRRVQRGRGNEPAAALLRRRPAARGLRGWLAVRLEAYRMGAGLGRLLRAAGLSWRPGTVAPVMLATTVAVGAAIALLLPIRPLVAGLIGALAGIGGPLAALYLLQRTRLRKFSEQLPDALDTMVRSLRAGHPIPAALQAIAEQMNDPVGGEFAETVSEMTYGLDLPDALERLGERVPLQELRFLTVSVSIQHKAGGNLAEVLANLARVMRAREGMRLKAKAISAEGRLSWILLAIAPFAFIGLIFLSNPGYYLDVVEDPLFARGMTVAAGLQAICSIVLWRLVHFKV